jgi:hypothetical protein
MTRASVTDRTRVCGLTSQKLCFWGACVCLFFTLAGCVTLKRPAGQEWAEPVDMRLHADALAGTTITFTCGSGERGKEEFKETVSTGCKKLVRSLIAIGAQVNADESLFGTIIKADEEDQSAYTETESDFRMIYIDRGVDRDYGGWTLFFCIPYLTFWPCVEDLTAYSELRLVGSKVGPETIKLELPMKTIIGPAALIYMGIGKSGSRIAWENQIAKSLPTFVAGKAFSYARKQMLY